MEIQRLIQMLPPTLRRHRLIRALTALHLASRLQRIRFNGNAQVVVDVDDGNSRTILINGQFDPEYFRIARAFLGTGGVCFDVGANFGLCSFGLAPVCPGVVYHLFEANPRLWPSLRRSMALHQALDVRLVEAAVGERNGAVTLNDENPDHDIGQGFIGDGGAVSTRMITLDDYISGAGVPRVDFTKMDIEGYELLAIEGAQREIAAGKLPVVYFELKKPLVARFGKSVFDVLDRFRAAGYRLFHVRDQDFEVVKAPRDLEIQGLRVAPVQVYPENLWTDLLAVHVSAAHIPVRSVRDV